jgi:hypothetical protein
MQLLRCADWDLYGVAHLEAPLARPQREPAVRGAGQRVPTWPVMRHSSQPIRWTFNVTTIWTKERVESLYWLRATV